MDSLDSLPVDALPQLIRSEAGGVIRTSGQGVAAANLVHQRLVFTFASIIGKAGFDALFLRALSKAKLLPVGDLHPDAPAQAIVRFCEQLETQDPSKIEASLVVMLESFINLVSTFIGEVLTLKLLSNTWPGVLLNKAPEGKKP